MDLNIKNIKGYYPFKILGVHLANCTMDSSEFTFGKITGSYIYGILSRNDVMVSNCRIKITNETCIRGANVLVINCRFLSGGSGGTDRIIDIMGNCTYIACEFDGIYFAHGVEGTSLMRYIDCKFLNVGSNRAIYTNYNNATNLKLIIRNCHFEVNNAAYTPICRYRYNPTKTIISNCTTNATAMHSLTSGVTENNNMTAW
ncbi:Uncharacterised protein [uncultured archaeon]|nr:Uncharacterised protein [uncultured archaeon]